MFLIVDCCNWNIILVDFEISNKNISLINHFFLFGYIRLEKKFVILTLFFFIMYIYKIPFKSVKIIRKKYFFFFSIFTINIYAFAYFYVLFFKKSFFIF